MLLQPLPDLGRDFLFIFLHPFLLLKQLSGGDRRLQNCFTVGIFPACDSVCCTEGSTYNRAFSCRNFNAISFDIKQGSNYVYTALRRQHGIIHLSATLPDRTGQIIVYVYKALEKRNRGGDYH